MKTYAFPFPTSIWDDLKDALLVLFNFFPESPQVLTVKYDGIGDVATGGLILFDSKNTQVKHINRCKRSTNRIDTLLTFFKVKKSTLCLS